MGGGPASPVLRGLRAPVVLAPLAGGPFTPELAAAVSEAGGLGHVAGGYLSAAALGERLAATRALTEGPLAAGLFAPPAAPADAGALAPYAARVAAEAARAGVEPGQARRDDDDWAAKLDLLADAPPAVISFTFGCPAPEELAALAAAGAETWVTVTSPAEAVAAEAAGATALIVQGAEAGGHRGTWVDAEGAPVIALLPLLQLVRRASGLPLVATGGIATRAAVGAVLAAGAAAAQVGTAFLLTPEAGTSAVHRAALAERRPTVLTRAYTGRLARGLENRFARMHTREAPVAYPEIHHLTAPLRRAGRERGDGEVVNLWAGEAYALAEAIPAAEVVAKLSPMR